MPSSTARAVVSLSDTGNHPRDVLFQHRLCSIQSIEYGYNHPRDAFSSCSCSCESIRYGQSSQGCALPALLVQVSVYRVRLYQIRAIIQGIRSSGTTCAVVSLSSTVTIIRGMPYSTACAVVSLSDTGNRLRDALFRNRLYSLQSTENGYNNHPRDAFFYCLCSCQSIRYGQVSKACALPASP